MGIEIIHFADMLPNVYQVCYYDIRKHCRVCTYLAYDMAVMVANANNQHSPGLHQLLYSLATAFCSQNTTIDYQLSIIYCLHTTFQYKNSQFKTSLLHYSPSIVTSHLTTVFAFLIQTQQMHGYAQFCIAPAIERNKVHQVITTQDMSLHLV